VRSGAAPRADELAPSYRAAPFDAREPFPHQPERTGRQLPRNQRRRLDIDRGLIIGIPSVEVRAAEMVDLIVVHPDHDSVEGADPRHGVDDPRVAGRFSKSMI
jgi:hypothetical protein